MRACSPSSRDSFFFSSFFCSVCLFFSEEAEEESAEELYKRKLEERLRAEAADLEVSKELFGDVAVVNNEEAGRDQRRRVSLLVDFRDHLMLNVWVCMYHVHQSPRLGGLLTHFRETFDIFTSG